MPISIVPKALYPFVPQAAGVPALLRSGAAILDTLTFGQLGIADALGDIIGTGLESWGIFNSDGDPVADYDSIFSLDYDNQTKISDYPVELGGFASYNKVNNPYDIGIIITCGGSADRRADCLTALQLAKDSTDLYSVFTPTDTILDANIVGIGYSSRAEAGATLLSVRLTLREVRQTGQATMSAPQSPSAFLPQAQGQVQTVDDTQIDVTGFA